MRGAVRKLRPRKIAGAFGRRWFERRLEMTPLISSVDVEELGSAYGGWLMPTTLIGADWTCYSIGAGADVTFDLELIERYGVTIRSVEPVAEYAQLATQAAAGDHRFTIIQAALAVHDGPLRMQVTHHPGSKSVSPVELYETRRYVEVNGRSLSSLMREFGDHSAQLLKLDVEGGEYELLPTLPLGELDVRVLAVQLHHNGGVSAARSLMDGLAQQGYIPVACRRAVKMTFVHVDELRKLADRFSQPSADW